MSCRESSSRFQRRPGLDRDALPDGQSLANGKSAYYQDPATITGAARPTWAARNPYTEVYGEGDRRIDYVLVSHARSDRSGVVHSCRLAFDEPSTDGVFPSDHFGVFAEIWLARNLIR